jgi:hypothetical protein
MFSNQIAEAPAVYMTTATHGYSPTFALSHPDEASFSENNGGEPIVSNRLCPITPRDLLFVGLVLVVAIQV